MTTVSHIGFLGYGQIGESLRKCIHEDAQISVSDPVQGFNDDLSTCDVVHVSVPQTSLMMAMGERKWGEMQDQILIIHTTTKPGDMKVIADHFQHCFKAVYHAPVRGKHPDLTSSIQNFVMPISGPAEHIDEVLSHLEYYLDVIVDHWGEDYINTELAKQLSTLRYAWEIMFRKHLDVLCKNVGADPKLVNDRWTEQYNEGYDLLDHPEFRRSILQQVPGPIGGHCVIPNAQAMADTSEMAQWILCMNALLNGDVPTAEALTQIYVE